MKQIKEIESDCIKAVTEFKHLIEKGEDAFIALDLKTKNLVVKNNPYFFYNQGQNLMTLQGHRNAISKSEGVDYKTIYHFILGKVLTLNGCNDEIIDCNKKRHLRQ